MKKYSSDIIIAYLALISGLTISAVAVWYSVAGLVSIFAAAAIPIMIMGIALEVSKLVASVWLKQNWDRAPRGLKWYLSTAVVVLMIITSMGIFGFLSKAHLDQNLVSGDVIDKVAIIDEKIKTQKDNIEAARKALRQMDDAVDQTMSRSTSEQGADKAASLRRSQQRERINLQNDIGRSQSEIAKLNEQRAPMAKDLRAVEAEVGPIKYIAKLIYGDNPDANLLEKAVTWVIMIIIFVFDPLAVLLLLASQYSFQWLREKKDEEDNDSEEFFEKAKETFKRLDEDVASDVESKKESVDPSPPGWMFSKIIGAVTSPENVNLNKEQTFDEKKPLDEWNEMIVEAEKAVADELENEEQQIIDSASDTIKEAMTAWKHDNPESSLKLQRRMLEKGIIKELPWMSYLKPQVDYVDEATEEALKWAEEQVSKQKENTKSNEVVWMEHDEQGQQIKKSKDVYQQNAEQNERTIWQRIQDAKK